MKTLGLSFKMIILSIIITLSSTSCHTFIKSQAKTLEQLPKELLGNFTDDYGSIYQITNKVWMHGTGNKYHLISYNKANNFIIAQNDKSNVTDGGLFTRIDIVYFNQMDPWKWGYCLTAYKASSFEEALNTNPANRNNPKKGCGGFPFSRMKRN